MRLTTLVLVAALSTRAGGEAPPAVKQDLAVAAIQKLGGAVEFEGAGGGRRAVKVTLHGDKITDADLANLAHLPDVRILDLEGACKSPNLLTNGALKHVGKLSKLESLNLEWHQGVTDAGVKHLAGLAALREVNLELTGVTARGVAELQQALPKARVRGAKK